MTFSFFYVFLSSSSGGDLDAYVTDYLSGKAVSASGVRSPTATPEELSACLAARAADAAAYQEARSRASGGPALAALAPALDAMADRFALALPLLPGETLRHGSMGVLGPCPGADLPADTLVYERVTDRATMAFIAAGVRADVARGRVGVARPPDAKGDDGGGIFFSTLVLLTEFVAPAFGPEGMVVSGITAVISFLMQKAFGSQEQQIPLATVLSEVLEAQHVEDEIGDAFASIEVSYEWFRQSYLAAWAGGPVSTQSQDPEFLQDFKTNLVQHLGPDSQLLAALGRLQEDDVKLRGLPVFLFGASLHLTLLKVRLLLDSSVTSSLDSAYLAVMVDTYDEYVSYAADVLAADSIEYTTRLANVGPILTDYKGSAWGPRVDVSFVDHGGGLDHDPGETYSYEDDAKSNLPKQMAQDQRAEVLARLTARQLSELYVDDPYTMDDTLKQWRTARDQYAAFLPAPAST